LFSGLVEHPEHRVAVPEQEREHCAERSSEE